MKKLFLTSGIIACMACPAFADPGFTPAQGEAAYANNGDGSVAEACVVGTIGTYSGDTTLVAQWTNDFALMKLNDNNGTGETAGGDTTHTWDTGSTSIWTTSNLYITGLTNQSGNPAAGKVVYKQNSTTGNFELQTPTDAAVVSIPQGAQVTYTVTTTAPGTGSASTVTSTTERRPFRGYFASGATNSTDDNQAYIDSTGKVTSLGENANYDNANPWKALYGYASPNLSGDPTAYGYAFQGWSINGSQTLKSTADVNASNILESKTADAVWQAKVWDVTFSCGTGATHTTAPSATTWTFDNSFTVPGNTDLTGCGKQGYHFTGWTCKQGDNTVETFLLNNTDGVTAGTTSSNLTASLFASLVDDAANSQSPTSAETANDIVCTADYTENDIRITWDLAEGTGTIPTESRTCTYTEDVVLPENPTRTGYTFNGWAVGTGDNAPEHAAGLD